MVSKLFQVIAKIVLKEGVKATLRIDDLDQHDASGEKKTIPISEDQ